jgi:nucleotide-binding universal stress UspA family protein
MIRKFLVAIDGSASASRALDLAIELAGSTKAALAIISVGSQEPLSEGEAQFARAEFKEGLPQASGVFTPLMAESDAVSATLAMADPAAGARVREAIGQRLVEMASELARQKGLARVSTHVSDGDPANEILAAAREEKADIIAMGTRGLGAVKGLVMGSVSQKVVQQAGCSVITVK